MKRGRCRRLQWLSAQGGHRHAPIEEVVSLWASSGWFNNVDLFPDLATKAAAASKNGYF
jgi:hypothetical protein